MEVYRSWDIGGKLTRATRYEGEYSYISYRTITDSYSTDTRTYANGATEQKSERVVYGESHVSESASGYTTFSGSTSTTVVPLSSFSGSYQIYSEDVKTYKLTSSGSTFSYSSEYNGVTTATSITNDETFTFTTTVDSVTTTTSNSTFIHATGTTMTTAMSSFIAGSTLTRQGVGFAQGADGKTETFVSTFIDDVVSVIQSQVSVLTTKTETTEGSYEVGTTSQNIDENAEYTVTTAYEQGYAKEATTYLLFSYGRPRAEYAWALNFVESISDEIEWSQLRSSQQGKFSDFYYSTLGDVEVISNLQAIALESYKIPTFRRSINAIAIGSIEIIDGTYTYASGTTPQSSTINKTSSVDRGDLVETYTIENETRTRYHSYTVDGRSYDESSSYVSFVETYLLQDYPIIIYTIPRWYGSYKKSVVANKGIATQKPVYYQVYETYSSSSVNVDEETVTYSLASYLGLRSEYLNTFLFSNYTTTVQEWTGVRVPKYSYVYKTTTNNYEEVIEVDGDYDVTYKEVNSLSPAVQTFGFYNSLELNRAGYELKGYYTWYRYASSLLGGFMGSTQGSYDDIQLGKSISMEVIDGENFGTEQDLKLEDFTFKILDNMLGIYVLAFETGQSYVAPNASCTYHVTNTLPAASLATSTEILARFSTTVVSTDRLDGTTFTGASVKTAKLNLALTSMVNDTYFRNYPLSIIHSDHVRKAFTAVGGGISNAAGDATIYVNRGHVTYGIYESTDTVAAVSSETHDTNNTVSFIIPKNKAIIISAEPEFSVGYTGVDGYYDSSVIASDLYDV